MIPIGSKMDTSIMLKVVQEGDEKEVLLSDLLNKPAVITVYFRNNTPTCDRQALALLENEIWFQKKGYNVIAISKDTCGSHKRYAKKHGIGGTLVSDPDRTFAIATDTMTEKKMFGRTFEDPTRSAFVIDTDGTILAAVEKIDTKAPDRELKALVNDL